MIRIFIPVFALLFCVQSAIAEQIYPRQAERAGIFELGTAILLLMPPKGSQFIDWSHESNGSIVWLTDGFEMESWANGDEISRRQGLLNIHVLGNFSHVLKQKKYKLAWTVQYLTKSNPKFGVETISILPGPPGDVCFGTLYDGCTFEILPSLKKAGLTVKQLCEQKGIQHHTVGYLVNHPNKVPMHLVLSESWGSGGSSSSVEMAIASKNKNLCQ